VKDEHYQEYTQDFLDRREKQRKLSVVKVWILGYGCITLAVYVGAFFLYSALSGLGLEDSWVRHVLGVVIAFVAVSQGEKMIKRYIRTRGLSKW
jgi:hypothetical protein